MVRYSLLLLLPLGVFACTDKTTTPPDDSSDDTGKGKDDTATDDSQVQGDDTGIPADDGRLRPGFWRILVQSVPEDSCGFGIAAGNTFPMEVTTDNEGYHVIDQIQRVIYDEANPGHFMANGVGLRPYDGIDCQLETRVNANGTYTDWQNIDFYGKESILDFTGADCAQADINGGNDCRLDLVLSAIWQGDDPPDTGN